MRNASAGTHDLHIACFSAAFVAQVIFMSDGAVSHIGDDFHVTVRMFWETGAGSDDVVVPHAQIAPVHALRVVVLGERKVMMRVQPAVIRAAQCVERSEFKHDDAPVRVSRAKDAATRSMMGVSFQ